MYTQVTAFYISPGTGQLVAQTIQYFIAPEIVINGISANITIT